MGFDGVMVVMVVMAPEKRFNITITDQEAEALRVVEDLRRDVPRDHIRPGSSWHGLGIT